MEYNNKHQEIEWQQPAFLNQEERNNPFLVIHDFFDSSYLFHVREVWWNYLYYAFSSQEADGLPAFTRADLLCIHKAILKLIEAASLIDKLNLQDNIKEIIENNPVHNPDG